LPYTNTEMLYISTIGIEIICLEFVSAHADGNRHIRFCLARVRQVQERQQGIEDRGPISSIRYPADSCRRIFLRMLSADFRAHEKNVGDAEANGHQAEQGCNVRPDQVEALAQLQRGWQDPFGLAL
jgi:hypothetical protein